MKLKKVLALVLALAMVLSLAACGGDKETEPAGSQDGSQAQTDAPEAEIQEGGTLTVSSAIPTTLEWTQIRGIMEIAYMSPIYETLMRYGEDGSPEPYLLESITPNSEALTWTMKVRSGIKFSDGSDLDAEAVAWNLNYYKENGILASSYYANFEKAEATDASTVVCHFTTWDALFDYSLCRTTLIASKKAFDEKGKDDLIANPVGTGPFTLKSITTDVDMVLTKNPNYWQGEVHLDELKMVKYQQEVVAATAIQTGEIQAMTTEAYSIVNQVINSGADLQNYASANPSYAYTLCFNMRGDDPCADLKVRQAMSYAIDPNTINDTLTYGYGKVSNQWAMEGTPMYNDDVEGQPYDLEKAKALMKEAGYENGFSTTLTYSSTTLLGDVAQMIADQLAKINIKVELRPIEGAAYVNYIGGWEQGMLLHTMGFEAGAPSQYTTTFVNGLAFGLGMNAFTISDELHNMSKAIASSKTEDELKENTYKVAKEVFDNQTMCKVVLVTSAVSFVSPKVHDHEFSAVQNLRYDVWKAWIEK